MNHYQGPMRKLPDARLLAVASIVNRLPYREVHDLGAGGQALRNLLRRGVRYLPYDECVPADPEAGITRNRVHRVDFDEDLRLVRPHPEGRVDKTYRLAVACGLLEYVDVLALLEWTWEHFDATVLTYAIDSCPEDVALGRQNNWEEAFMLCVMRPEGPGFSAQVQMSPVEFPGLEDRQRFFVRGCGKRLRDLRFSRSGE